MRFVTTMSNNTIPCSPFQSNRLRSTNRMDGPRGDGGAVASSHHRFSAPLPPAPAGPSTFPPSRLRPQQQKPSRVLMNNSRSRPVCFFLLAAFADSLSADDAREARACPCCAPAVPCSPFFSFSSFSPGTTCTCPSIHHGSHLGSGSAQPTSFTRPSGSCFSRELLAWNPFSTTTTTSTTCSLCPFPLR